MAGGEGDRMIYRFGDCILDVELYELRRTDEVINTEPKVLEVLRYLLEHRERVVSREELLEQCWPETYVSDAALSRCLGRVRQAIGQSQTEPPLIQTVHGRGYRFVAAVTELAAAPSVDLVPPEAPSLFAPATPSAPSESSLDRPGPDLQPDGRVRSSILIVEDDPDSRDILEQQLRRQGYETRSAADGQEALVEVAAQAPDLIVLDVMMPGMDGFSVCQRLKERDDTRLIPIIMLTALDSAADRIHGIAVGADDFLTKPVNRHELLARIQTALRLKHTVDRKLSERSQQHEPPSQPLRATAASVVAEEAAAPAAGAPVEHRPPSMLVAERRQLTVLSCVLNDADSLMAHLDAEDYHDMMQAFRSTCLRIIDQYAGHVAQHFHDGFLVHFGYPQAHEDDVRRAIRSGLALVETLVHHAGTMGDLPVDDLAVRVGIHTGWVIVEPEDASGVPLLEGATPRLVAELCALAFPQTVVISASTAQLVEGYFECKALESHQLSGQPEPLPIYQVKGESRLHTRLEVDNVRGLTTFVGRETEMALLRERWALVQEGLGQVVVISGDAGIGKSRLVQELKEEVTQAPHRLVECRCSPSHRNTTLYPVVDLFRRFLNRQPDASALTKLEQLEDLLRPSHLSLSDTVPLFAALLSLPLPPERYRPVPLTPQRQRQKLQEILLALLAQQPDALLLLIVEDLHWADPSTLEFLDLLMTQVPTSALLVVLTCRPEFEPPWGFRTQMTPMMLNRLTPSQVEQLVRSVSNGKVLPPAVVQQIVAKTDGVPLFVEELTRMVLASDQLQEQADCYELRSELTQLSIPATLQDSLMARLDRLEAGKEVAQWGAVLGREFTYEILAAVTSFDTATLQGGLSQLVQAELVFQRGVVPQALYRFKHALIQDTAYESLLKRKRQQMHQQVGQVMMAQFSETVETQPELVAHHYTEAGLAEPAIAYWHRAGQLATQRSANAEAVSHLTTGIALLATCPETAARARQELALHIALGAAWVAVNHAAPEVERTYARARDLCMQVDENSQLFPVLTGLWRSYSVRGELQRANELGVQLLELAQHPTDADLPVFAYMALGYNAFYLGAFPLAHAYFVQGMVVYAPHRDRPHTFADPGITCLSHDAMALWMLGYPDQALAQSRVAITLAQTLGHSYSLAFACYFTALFHQFRQEAPTAQEWAEAGIALCRDQGFVLLETVTTMLLGWALSVQGRDEAGLAQLRQGFGAYQASGGKLNDIYGSFLQAEASVRHGDIDQGLQELAEAQGHVEATEVRWWEAELYRLQGALLLEQKNRRQSGIENGDDQEEEAETCLQRALDVARGQHAKSLELRAAMGLARLWQSTGKRTEAHKLLALVYGWFTEGFDTPDLQEAKALLANLA